MTHRRRRRRASRPARNNQNRLNSSHARLAVQARYGDGELTVEARDRAAIIATVVIFVVVAIAAIVVATATTGPRPRDLPLTNNSRTARA